LVNWFINKLKKNNNFRWTKLCYHMHLW
jgi:hypothetical protein